MGYTALITGASTGLGGVRALQVSGGGVSGGLVARDEHRLRALADELRGSRERAEVIAADLTTAEGLERVAARLADDDRPIDILINNAGFGVYDGFERSDIAAERRLHELLSWAPLRLSHAAVPGMLQRGRGWILNVASVAAFTPTGTYGAAKAAVVSLSRSLNARYRARGVRVTALCPGLLDTEFHERMGLDHLPRLPRMAWADTSRVAREGLRALSRGRSVMISDWRYRLVAPLTRVLPDRLLERVSTTNEGGPL
ncbi:SDR family NAD(P)-dependent oxidoreductase [Leucobacter sp. CSA1]|uniref:SDR family NAD(P)-dependent oxidoreductase n=1 Tax=Leucobacter chromiisoli TaxID=2796471 RepID=A0A934UUI4_9MICO|nr:SDR family NAD(P)-dependent oxidoreductase [Leucobacter chromiisoli]MBK0418850.1 SDR family NAD(P)-dependent oxidoreductase [Leucobacter chromiisoli]